MSGEQVASYLNHLVPAREVSPSTQSQALNALVLFYEQVLDIKGVFIYHSHEEMAADRLRWTVNAVVERQRTLWLPHRSSIQPGTTAL